MGDLQAAIYAKLKLQGKLRTLGRIISYVVIPCTFVAITYLYLWNYCTTVENIRNMILIPLYTVLIQDTINTVYQFVAIMYSGWSKGTSPNRCKKIIMKTILKEVLEAIVEVSKQESISVNQESNASVIANQSVDGVFTTNMFGEANAAVHTNNMMDNSVNIPRQEIYPDLPSVHDIPANNGSVRALGLINEFHIEPQNEELNASKKDIIFTENNDAYNSDYVAAVQPQANVITVAESPVKLEEEKNNIKESPESISPTIKPLTEDVQEQIFDMNPEISKSEPPVDQNYEADIPRQEQNEFNEDVFMEEVDIERATTPVVQPDVITSEKAIKGKVLDADSRPISGNSESKTKEDRPQSSNLNNQ